MAKSVANYANAQLIKLEAVLEGYQEGIALDTQGESERRQRPERVRRARRIIFTPPFGNSVLSGSRATR